MLKHEEVLTLLAGLGFEEQFHPLVMDRPPIPYKIYKELLETCDVLFKEKRKSNANIK